jgi:AcrR family transcriptional regulator
MASSEAETTPERILDAAAAEFAEHGFAGSRVDRIARLAGCNKQLLYHYFGSKEGLRHAVFRRGLVERGERLRNMEGGPAEMIAAGFASMGADENWIRMMLWERLSATGCEFADERRAHFQEMVDRATWVADPALRPFVTLACMGMAAFPWTLPQVAELVTERDLRSDEFRNGYLAAIQLILGERAAAAPPAAPSPEAAATPPAAPRSRKR